MSILVSDRNANPAVTVSSIYGSWPYFTLPIWTKVQEADRNTGQTDFEAKPEWKCKILIYFTSTLLQLPSSNKGQTYRGTACLVFLLFRDFMLKALILNNLNVVKDVRADYYTHRNEDFYLKFIFVAIGLYLLLLFSQATYPVPWHSIKSLLLIQTTEEESTFSPENKNKQNKK